MKTNSKNSAIPDLITPNLKTINIANSLMIALRNPLRQKILKLLLVSPKMPVNTIIRKTKGEQSIISQHLGVLREHQLVTTIRDGRSIHYSVNHRRLQGVLGKIKAMAS